jgi:predicted dehydrogenase
MEVNWGIIGPGRIARKFADDLRRLPQARLLAVASTSPERAAAFAAEYDVQYAFGSYSELLDCAGLDVVYIANTHAQHAEAAIQCLERGIAVLVEKPSSLCAADTERMVRVAQERGVFLMEGIWSFFIPGFAQALEWVRSGRIGRVHLVQADFGFIAPFDPNWRLYHKVSGGGSLLDIGLYPVLLMLAAMGRPDWVDAWARWAPTGVDETAVFRLHYQDGRVGTGFSTLTATTPTEACIYGDLGRIDLHSRFHHPQHLTLSTYEDRNLVQQPHHLPYEGHGYHFEAQHVMDCLAAGLTESPVLPLSFSIDLIHTLDALRSKMGLVYE